MLASSSIKPCVMKATQHNAKITCTHHCCLPPLTFLLLMLSEGHTPARSLMPQKALTLQHPEGVNASVWKCSMAFRLPATCVEAPCIL